MAYDGERFAMRIGLGLGSASGEMKREINNLSSQLSAAVAKSTSLEKENSALQASLHRQEIELRRCGGHAIERSMRAVRNVLIRLLKGTLRPHEIEALLKEGIGESVGNIQVEEKVASEDWDGATKA